MSTLPRAPHLFPPLDPPGPLEPVVRAYEARLAAQSYSRRTALTFFWALQALNRWLLARGWELAQLTEEALEEFVRERQCHQRLGTRLADRSALRKLVTLLRERGHFPAEVSAGPAPVWEEIVEDFDRFLRQERGLASVTRHYYCVDTRAFLRARFGDQPADFAVLAAEDAAGFLRQKTAHLSPKGAAQVASALRAFLRYLRARGTITADLADALVTGPAWTLGTLPRYLEARQVRQVFQTCDRRTCKGRRDYAILLLLARLGLRGGEVASLTLEDLHWETGLLTVRGKGGRSGDLPLPLDVGAALATYLTQDRPPCASRRVFLCLRAPRRPFANTEAVSTIVARHLKAAGIDCPYTGAHVFRHTVATQMLRRGGSLAEIAQLLRHRSFDTTMLYAKVDVEALRTLAFPWPEQGGRP